MRLCKGDFVEVLSKKEVPTGSWHCAEVIRGNGHTYIIKYVCFRSFNEGNGPLTERVSRKALRPCPPPVERDDDWVAGDLVEVYHNMSWKIATVTKNLGQHIFLVRLLGESREFEVHRLYLRVRQSWEDGKWFIAGKQGGCAYDMKKKYSSANTQLNVALKRASPVSLTNLEADKNNCSQKMGVTEIDTSQKRKKQKILEQPSPLSGKVDDYIPPQEKLGGNFVHKMLDIEKYSFSSTNLDMDEYNQFNYKLTRTSRSCGTNSAASSVGSCSINNPITNKNVNVDPQNLCSDAESRGSDGVCYTEKNVKLLEHRLDLILYRRALKTMYASGPLSWEDEIKVVDLQDALNISNDEHLAEINFLISTPTRIPVY